jgi:SAM-dependent methyltransferase
MRADEKFRGAYAKRSWANQGVLSGDGSRWENCAILAAWLNEQPDAGMRSVLDLGCGDLEWVARCEAVTEGRIRYHGVDVVPPLIEHHRRVFPWFRGEVADLEGLPLIEADVVILKDVLCHLCNGAAGQILMNVERGRWKRLLVSTTPGANNTKRRGLGGSLRYAPFDVEASGLISGSPAAFLPGNDPLAIYER